MLRHALIGAGALLALGAGGDGATGPGVPGPGTRLAGCPVFPADNAWNRDISQAPVDPRSDAYIRSIGLDGHLHPDFAAQGLRDPVPRRAAARSSSVPVHFTAYGDESDKGPYPIPRDARRSRAARTATSSSLAARTCKLYELFGAQRAGRRLDGRRGRALRPALQPAAARRAGRRPTPPACRSCPAWPAPARSRGRRDHATRCAFTVRAHAEGLRLARAALRVRRAPTRTCRRWACACG